MAKETYKIIFSEDFGTHKAGTQISGQTFEQQMDFMMDNFDNKGKFKIEPEQKITTAAAKDIVKKSDTEKYEDEKEKFLDSLTAGELSSIREGKKKICHNMQVGFYLRLLSSKPEANETHISLYQMREKETRSIYKAMKAYLMGNTPTSWSQISGRIVSDSNLFTEEDLREMVEDLFKGRC